MAGSYVVGWALRDEGGHCAVVVTDEAGVELARGIAGLERADLGKLGVGRSDFGFRIPLRNGPERRVLQVAAEGVALTGSPITTGLGNWDHEYEVTAGRVRGWVSERVYDAAAPVIQVVNQHGAVLGLARATPDESEGDPFHRPARFDIELDDRCFGCGELRLRLLANGVRFGEQSCIFKLASSLDFLTDENYTGWLVAPDAPGRNLKFDVYQDGVLAGTVACNIAREDVREVHPGCATPGFAVTLPRPRHSAVDTTAVSFRFKGSNLDLFKGPYVVASRPAAVLAAQRAAQASYQAFEGLGATERAIAQVALRDFTAAARRGDGFIASQQRGGAAPAKGAPRLTIVVPVFKGVAETRACIASVLAHRNAATDQLVVIDDASPEPQMAEMLAAFAGAPNCFLLANPENLGFVKTANRGIGFALGGDVLLLNADAQIFAGGLDELCAAGRLPGVGTVTALSDNATVFSYPHPALAGQALSDMDWPELAATALSENAGLVIDVPTGHGFCLLLKGEVTRRIGGFDEGFGRGYGEENDFCARAASWGYRNVVAAGVLVTHLEGVSFTAERAALMAQNMPRLEKAYPEYQQVIWTFVDRDGLRRARWALDKARLRKAVAAGQKFVLLVSNALEGGTAKAVRQIEALAEQTGGATAALTLSAQSSGLITLAAAAPALQASFAPDEIEALFEVLEAARPVRVAVHQLLGFPAAFLARIGEWARGRHSLYYAHDFYPLCPRVTLVDAGQSFCDVAEVAVCARCVKLGGAHPASRMTELSPATHRALFGLVLQGFREVIAPSRDTVGYLKRVFPELPISALAHPEPPGAVAEPRRGKADEIVLFGGINAAKGSGMLLELAGRARLSHPKRRFTVIGHSDMDAALLALGNVTMTGKYPPEALAGLVAATAGRLALFLQIWPETYSYTLSEAARFGFLPVVPDIGAPAERVRAAGYGVVYPFGVTAARLLEILDEIAAGRWTAVAEGATPAALLPGAAEIERAAAVLAGG